MNNFREFYDSYLHTSHWRRTARKVKKQKHYTCEICRNHLLMEVTEILRDRDHPSWCIPEIARFADMVIECNGDQDRLIQIHHKSYKNVGHETSEDLACICRPCHVLLTENMDGIKLDCAWIITVNQVHRILKRIHNQPDGISEFACFVPIDGETLFFDDDLEKIDEDHFSFREEFFEIEEEFE